MQDLAQVNIQTPKEMTTNLRNLATTLHQIMTNKKLPVVAVKWALVAICICSLGSHAEDQLAAPKHLIISYGHHPTMDRIILPRVQKAYQKLGIQVDFVPTNTERFVKLFQQNLVDGDVARINRLQQQMPDLVDVALIDQVQASYHCRPTIPCSLKDLADPDLRIYLPAIEHGLAAMEIKIRAKLYIVNDWNQLLMMYNRGRIDRFIWLNSEHYHNAELTGTVRLNIPHPQTELHHVLRKKHSAIFPKIKTAIEYEMALKP